MSLNHLTDADVRTAVEKMLLTSGMPSDTEVAESLTTTILSMQADSQVLGAEMVERYLNRPGGRALLLRDIFSLWDVVTVFAKAGSSYFTGKSPLAVALPELLKTYRKYRKIAVELNAVEYRIMISVKAGSDSEESIAEDIGANIHDVSMAVSALTQKHYREELPLLRKDSTGRLTTDF
jgi:hypothetical protein